MTRNQFYWLLQIVGWALYAVVGIILVSLANQPDPNNIISLVLTAFWFLLSTHFFRIYIKKQKWIKLSLQKLIPRILLAIFILGISNYLFQVFNFVFLGLINPEKDFSSFVVLTSLFSYMIFYFVWSLIYFIYHYIDNYNKSLKYEAAINEFELNKLKSQLNPHFIFNALNSIRALVDEDPVKCKTAITQLSTILRSSLVMNKNKLTNFNEELEAVKDYLDLESIRFEERLTTNFDIDSGSEDYRVPPLMIQTLIENGIKHGIAHLKEGGTIKLSTKIIDSKLHIYIRNNGQFKNGISKANKGFGLENTKRRLHLIYGNHASLSIKNEDENTVLTKVIIPQIF